MTSTRHIVTGIIARPRFVPPKIAYSSKPAIAARNFVRRNRRLYHVVVVLNSLIERCSEYERRFKSAMTAELRPGDCVWDVGANVGHYSELFAATVGPSGTVVSFEPSPACVEILNVRLREVVGATWLVIPVALSNTNGQAWLSTASGDISPNNRLVRADGPSVTRVVTARGDSIIASGQPNPDVVKIDVEGYEGEVLQGMSELLKSSTLRALFVEVHFSILNDLGKPEEPARIVKHLQEYGFTVKWIDRSHFAAIRRSGTRSESDTLSV